MSELELTISRTIPAPREKVFNAWLSPKILAQFMNTPMGGTAQSKVTNDPVKGGHFSIVMMNEDKEIPHAGTYLAILDKYGVTNGAIPTSEINPTG